MNKTLILFFVLACTVASAFAYTQSDLEDAVDMLSEQQQEVQDYSASSSSSSSDEEVSDMDNDMFFRSVFRAVGRAFRSFTSGGLSGILGRVGGLLSGGSDLFGRIGGLVSGGKSFLGSLGGLFKKGGGSFFDKLGGVFNQGRDLFNSGRSIFQDARGLLSGGPAGGIQDSDDEDIDDFDMDRDMFFRRAFRRIGRAFRRVGRFVGRAIRKVGGFIKKIAPYVLPLLGGPLGAVLGPIAGSISGAIAKGISIYNKVTNIIDTVKTVKALIKPPRPPQAPQMSPEEMAKLIVARLMEIDEIYKKFGKNVPKQYAFARDGKTPIAEEQKILMAELLKLKEAYEKAQAAQKPAAPAARPDPTAQITNLYRSMLGRAPDARGLAYWKGQYARGMTIQQIAQNFQRSPEFQRRMMNRGRVEDSESEYSSDSDWE